MEPRPPWRPSGANAILSLLVLLILVAAALVWASGDTVPNPSTTAAPETLPQGGVS